MTIRFMLSEAMRIIHVILSVCTVTCATHSALAADPTGFSIRPHLYSFQDNSGNVRPVRTEEDWTIARRQVILGMERAMGPLPGRNDLGPFEFTKRSLFDGQGFQRWNISIASGEGDRIPAHLYLPHGIEADERRPAMLALHPTSPIGKDVVAGLGPRPNRNYAEELAQRGYVVLAPDYPSFGEYSDYNFERDRHASGTMKGIFNHMRCVDYLQSRPDVDPEKLGVIGHSLGGHNAMFVGVFDQRLKVIVSSCGWTPFHDYYEGKIAGWTSSRYMPRLKTEYDLDPDLVPFDFYEVVAALAPRAFFSNSPLHDENFAVNGIKKAIPEARKIYNLLRSDEHLQIRYPDAGHDFPPAVRFETYRFIDDQLGFKTHSLK